MEIHDLRQETSDERRVMRNEKIIAIALLALLITHPSSLGAIADGYVVKADSATVYLDWGKSSGVAAGDQFSIYRSGEPLKHPVTGEILGQSEENLGQGVVDHVEGKFSTGKLVETKGLIKPG